MAKIIKKAVKPVNDSKKDILIDELTEVLDKLGYSVRIEKGVFRGGFCLLREQKLFLLNKNLDQDKKISILVKNIAGIGIEGIFLKPNIRELVEKETGESSDGTLL
ncbi:MAG TPA: hypothetical protein PKA90_00540 [Ignavibacteria bacterium]|nr:hypothetical protein [Ignavibacteria bacterium]HMR38892.1 hypothetical protein [Ignavibacteria bacterium]